jgi:hypothetical protein
LKRIDPDFRHAEKLPDVLVVFVARRPEGGQVIVGWYGDAELLRNEIKSSPGKPRGYGYFCSAERRNCVLPPKTSRIVEIPGGKGGIGQANVRYPLASNGTPKDAPWIKQALEVIGPYKGPMEPEEDGEGTPASTPDAC